MSSKQIVILVAAIFTLVAVLAVVTSRREARIGDRLTQVDAAEFDDVRFVKDPLRDSEGLDLPVEDAADLDTLAAALHTLQSSSVAIKTLDVVAETKIALQLDDELEIRVMRTTQLGDVGVVSVGVIAGPGEAPGGTYESAELLAWVEAMATRPGYEHIAEVR